VGVFLCVHFPLDAVSEHLRSKTKVFLSNSTATILAQTGKKPPLLAAAVTYTGQGPLVAEVVLAAQRLLLPAIPMLELEQEHGVQLSAVQPTKKQSFI